MADSTKSIKAVALDLDGTLLDSEHKLSEKNREILRKIANQGIKIIIASGRMSETILPVCRELEIPCSIIAYNGAKLFDFQDGKIATLNSVTISDETIKEVYLMCREKGIFLNVYAHNKLYGYHPQGDIQFGDFYAAQTGSKYVFCTQEIEKLPQEDITKLLTVTPHEQRESLFDELFSDFSRHCTLAKSQPEYLEFIPRGVTKATALKKWCELKKISPSHVFAMGDAENDLEMLQSAGQAVATANATPGLKKLFPNISEWTNDEDAVCRELERILEL
jgi:Cof subfamily protein (haloacid dehalogenase superfamily)